MSRNECLEKAQKVSKGKVWQVLEALLLYRVGRRREAGGRRPVPGFYWCAFMRSTSQAFPR